MLQIVIDTNVFVRSISKRSPYNIIFDAILKGKIKLILSNEILTEYEEILKNIATPKVFENIYQLIFKSPFVDLIDPLYHFQLITVDYDDNKFIDSAICGNADYIITSDKHFKEAKDSSHPIINVISPENFIKNFLQ